MHETVCTNKLGACNTELLTASVKANDIFGSRLVRCLGLFLCRPSELNLVCLCCHFLPTGHLPECAKPLQLGVTTRTMKMKHTGPCTACILQSRPVSEM